MKRQLLISKLMVTAIILAGVGLATQSAYSQQDSQKQDHEKHHPEGQPPAKKEDAGNMMGKHGMKDGMMGKMNMGEMKEMMHQCMSMHNDGKMCDHQMMEKCQEGMGKGECTKMMGQMKKAEKADKQKK